MKEDSEPYEVNPDKEWVIENIKNRIEILSSVQCFFHNELETPLILVLKEHLSKCPTAKTSAVKLMKV